jgi:hypothetical protein
MKATLLKSTKEKEVVEKYVKSATSDLYQVKLIPINKESGFCIDDNFILKVKERLKIKRLSKVMCANIIAVFLEKYEDKK